MNEDKQLIVSYTKKDFRVDTYMASGPGGQHRNKTQSAVRITHIPTGLFATSHVHKEQGRNKKEAFHKLAEKIKKYHEHLLIKEKFKNNEVIRTYNEPDNRVKDHETGLTESYDDVMIKSRIENLIEQRRFLKTTEE